MTVQKCLRQSAKDVTPASTVLCPPERQPKLVPCSDQLAHNYLFTLCAGTIPGVFNWIV